MKAIIKSCLPQISKTFFLLIGFLWAFNGFSQNKIAEEIQKLQKQNTQFTLLSPLTVDTTISKADINQAVTNATVAKMSLAKINQIATGDVAFLELNIPYQNQIYSILLYRIDPFTQEFKIQTDKQSDIAYQKGVYYRGIIKGNTNSVSSFNFFNGEFNGIFSSAELGNIVVGKIDKPNNQADYIVYSDANFLITNDFTCHTPDDNLPSPTTTSTTETTSIKCVTFYFEIDYNLYQANSSNSLTTSNWATSVFNNVQTLYASAGVTTALNAVYIWTTPDVYNNVGTTSFDYLAAFQDYRTSFNGDVGVLIGIDPGGLGGVAYLNGLCTSYNYGYSDVDGISVVSVPTYSWTTQVMTHELGHLMGSPHTHACFWNGNDTPIDGCGAEAGYPEDGCSLIGPIPTSSVKGTIMSYCHLISGVGISFANGFGPQPATLMVNNVNSKPCLSTDCTTCSNTVSSFQTTNISENSATIAWVDSGTQATWQISVRPFSATTSVWNTASQASYQATGLLPNTYYRARIRPNCTTPSSQIKEFVFATSGNHCGGTMQFYDTGGENNYYTNNESFTRTITPNVANKKIVATFTQFSVEGDYDYLFIYDGPNDTYPELNSGEGFTGSVSPGTITSTAADGSLTFKFESDDSQTDFGWKATISCLNMLGIGSNDYIDFTYYPNPTTNNVTLKANTSITKIEVYNVAGQKLFSQELEKLESTVDLSQFASGTYFFKVQFNDKEKNFKILKL